MIVDRDEIYEYPYSGEFYHTGIDESLPYDERGDEVKISDLVTSCDIIEASSSTKQEYTDAKWTVFFPINKEEDMSISVGLLFSGSIYGLPIEGRVLGIAPSQLGGCAAHLGVKTS